MSHIFFSFSYCLLHFLLTSHLPTPFFFPCFYSFLFSGLSVPSYRSLGQSPFITLAHLKQPTCLVTEKDCFGPRWAGSSQWKACKNGRHVPRGDLDSCVCLFGFKWLLC